MTGLWTARLLPRFCGADEVRAGWRAVRLGGDKTGDKRWYEVNVPIADRLYDAHLEELKREGLI